MKKQNYKNIIQKSTTVIKYSYLSILTEVTLPVYFLLTNREISHPMQGDTQLICMET